MIEFKLPELGENVTTGDVLRVLVKPGDVLAKEQPVLELETDKATIEVPSSVDGRIQNVNVKQGDKVQVGQTILTVEDQAAAADKPSQPPTAEGAGRAAQPAAEASSSPAPRRVPAAEQKRAAPEPPREPAVGANTAEKIPADGGLEQHVEGRKRPTEDKPGVITDNVVDFARAPRTATEPQASELPVAPAAPSVRRMARELGIDIDQVPGTGSAGRISIDDVKAYARRLITGAASASNAPHAEPLPDFGRWGDVERQPMRPVRRKTAEHLSAAWATIPHVTQHDLADITAVEELRKKYGKQAEAEGGNLTITAIAVKVAASALKVFPQFNASVDMAAGEIIYKKFVNIGIAVDTDRGLLVPVIKNADEKNIMQISVELAELSEKARTRKISLEEMQGGCFSISNLGGIGGSFFTPIVNAPEVAILGISRARQEPVYDRQNGSFSPRLMLPLSLSYDHRVVDGADGARFLRWIVGALEQPFVLALEG